MTWSITTYSPVCAVMNCTFMDWPESSAKDPKELPLLSTSSTATGPLKTMGSLLLGPTVTGLPVPICALKSDTQNMELTSTAAHNIIANGCNVCLVLYAFNGSLYNPCLVNIGSCFVRKSSPTKEITCKSREVRPL